MGSIEAACVGGFLCRLCSEVHRLVIHVYSDKGLRYGLAKKINAYLPVTISPDDPLPKTICRFCMGRLLNQHEFIVKIHKNQARFQNSRMHNAREAESSLISNGGTSQEPQLAGQTSENSNDSSTSSPVAAEEQRNIASVRQKRSRTQI